MLGGNIIYGIVTTGLTFYYQSVIFLPAIFISFLTVFIKVADIVKDPFIGAYMDKTVGRRGKFIPYLRVVPAITCILTVLLFINKIYGIRNSGLENALIALTATITYLIWSVVFSLGEIPLNSLPPLMTDNESQRNGLMASSRFFGTIGFGLISIFLIPAASYLGSVIAERTGDRDTGFQYGFIITVIILTLIGGVPLLFPGLIIKEKIKSVSSDKEAFSFKQSFEAMWSCKPYRRLMLSCLLRSPTVVFSVVQATMFVYYFGNNGSGGYVIYMLIYSLVTFLGQGTAMLLTPKLAARFNKRKIMVACNIALTAVFLSMYVLYRIFPYSLHLAIPFTLFSFIGLLMGICFGITAVLIPIMIADALDIYEAEYNKRPDGIFFSGMTMTGKLGYGISAVIVGIVFAAVGFSGDGVQAVNAALYEGAVFRTDEIFGIYRSAIFILSSIPPAIGALLSVIPLINRRR